MEENDKLKLLKALDLLDQIPDDQLGTLSRFLIPVEFKDGEVVFEEGTQGDCMYFISSGHVRILKRVLLADGTPSFKELAIIGPGDCFGEMEIFKEVVTRSARVQAAGPAVLFMLGRKQLREWLESHPTLAVGFFTELVQVLSIRLRRSSNELALLFDLSQWLLEPMPSGKDLLQKVLKHLIPHLEGTWTAGAYLYNEFNEEMDLVASEGDWEAVAAALPPPGEVRPESRWLDGRTFIVPFPGQKHIQGFLVFRSSADLPGELRTEFGRAMSTTARLITTALQNIAHRAEDAMRARLEATRKFHAGL